jgi:hypothetical protein
MRQPCCVLLVILGGVAGCSNDSDSPRSTDSSAKCVEPSNPWGGEEGGHAAGFDWAQEKGLECPSDHGQPFEEGCNEYYDQLHRYEECQASKK